LSPKRPGPLDKSGQGLRATQQQVVHELAASGGLRGDQIPACELVALGEYGDHVVGGAQHDFAGSHRGCLVLREAHLRQMSPQPPSGGEIQVEQCA
jgi:hypothetical protein